MPIVFMLEKPTRKRLRCISRVACEGYVLYAQKPAQGGGYDCALEGAGPLNAAGMAQAFMAAGIGEMLHNALHAEMEAGKRAARKARGKEKDGGNAAEAAQKEEGNAAAAATTLSIRHSRFAALPLAKLVASLALHPP